MIEKGFYGNHKFIDKQGLVMVYVLFPLFHFCVNPNPVTRLLEQSKTSCEHRCRGWALH